MSGLDANVAHIRYEDLNRHPARTLRALASGLGLDPPTTFRDVRTYKESATAPYLPRRYPPISATDRNFIAAHIAEDKELRLGYDIRYVPQNDGLGPMSYPVLLRRWKRMKAALGVGRPLKP